MQSPFVLTVTLLCCNPYLEGGVNRQRSAVGALGGGGFPELCPTQADHIPVRFGVDARLHHLAKVQRRAGEVPQLRSSHPPHGANMKKQRRRYAYVRDGEKQ